MRRQSRAAIVPMLTLSWLCDSVLRENAAAGIVSLSASAVSAEVEMPIALKPWLPPPFGVRFSGRPPLVAGAQSSCIWRSSRSATLATALLSPSIANATCPP